jgi:Tfp pilus assembly PilM family ATPase
MWPAASQPAPIGIDVGGRFAHAVQLCRAGRRWRVVATASVPRTRPDTKLGSGEAARLASVLHRQGFRGREIVLTLPADDFMACEFELTGRAASTPLAETARTRLAAAYKCAPDAMEVACWAPPQTDARVFAVGCAHAVANNLIDPFESAGFVVRALDVPSWAGARACRPVLTGSGLEPILNISWATAHIVVLYDGTVVHERALAEYGLRQLHASISEAYALEPDVADYILRTYGVSAEAGDDEARPDLAEEVRVHATGVLEALASDLLESMAYTNREYGAPGFQRLLLHGEGAAIPGVGQFLELLLGLDLKVVTPDLVAACDSMPAEYRGSPMMVTACGLGQHPGE